MSTNHIKVNSKGWEASSEVKILALVEFTMEAYADFSDVEIKEEALLQFSNKILEHLSPTSDLNKLDSFLVRNVVNESSNIIEVKELIFSPDDVELLPLD